MATQPVPASREGAPTALVGAARSLILSPLLPVLPPHPTPHPELSPHPQPKTLQAESTIFATEQRLNHLT